MTTSRTSPRAIDLRPPHHRIERRAILWWTLQSLALWVPVLAVMTAGYVLWEAARPWLAVALIVAGVLAVISTVVEPWWRYAVHRWEATDEAVYGSSGWLVREWRVAPISRVQTVDAVRGPIEQMLGLSTLRVTTASSKGAIDIVGLDRDVAAEAAERLTTIAQMTPGDAT
ncbi:PH domain-containing protein [Phytoactinopolyspora alkaliphila]|uniref:PH domain-containing protein n=1 Tax=Phytoactinopolyspora alkaliphila TaxID=1783498 RepID=A0A6N9YMX6_9ACTN|nr:PH domain-containing protein [Phytoactinopolyspora alkaliphila]NED96343.1 PH domain-containing protein [Phytoactinopolyspora alkaliphila]